MEKELKERLDKYLKLTKKALKVIKINKDNKEIAEDLLDLAKRYYQDALYFKEKNQLINAFAAVNYSHAFLDAGCRVKAFKNKNNSLFMVD